MGKTEGKEGTSPASRGRAPWAGPARWLLPALLGLAAWSPTPAAAQRVVDLAAGEEDVVVRGVQESAEMLSLHHSFAAADLDGDGVDDLVVAVPSGGTAPCPFPDAGAVYVFFGPLQGGSDLRVTDADLTICGNAPGDTFGSFLMAGRLGGSPALDLLVGAPLADSPTSGEINAGEARIFFGPLPSGTVLQADDADLTYLGCGEFDNTGASAAAGDLDGDGVNDLVLGAINARGPGDLRGNRVGEFYLFFGPLSSGAVDLCPDPEAAADVVVYGASRYDSIGREFALADLGGDPTTDILFGAGQALGVGPGFGAVLFGRSSWPATIDLAATSPDVVFRGGNIEDRYGFAVAAGDLDDDGHADALMGGYWADGIGNTRGRAGEVQGFYGPFQQGDVYDLAADPDAADLRIVGLGDSWLGWDMTLGEGTGCGTRDLHVSALDASRVYTFRGPFPPGTDIDLLHDTPDIEIRGERSDDFLGQVVARGDLNADGADDIVAVARLADDPATGAADVGAVYVVFGYRCPADCDELEEVRPSDLVKDDTYAASVAVWGDLMVASAQDGGQGHTGAAYVYRRVGGVWTQEAKIIPADASYNDHFAHQGIGLSGERFVAGAYDADPNGPHSGAAYVFAYQNGAWVQEAKLLPDDGAAGDEFGFSVALDGDVAVVGAPINAAAGLPLSGAAYVFERSNGSWSQTAKLVAPDAAAFDLLGVSVAVSGKRALVGTTRHDHLGNGVKGSAYVFVSKGNQWLPEGELLPVSPNLPDPWAAYGETVSLWGNTAAVSAVLENVGGAYAAGTVRVFNRAGGTWSLAQVITASDADPVDQFGRSISLAGPYLLVGAEGDDEAADYAGAGYLFLREGGSWTEEGKFLATDPKPGDALGFGRQAVAVGGGTFVLGARQHTHGAPHEGTSYVTRCGAEFGKVGDCLHTLLKQACQGLTGPEKGACVQDQKLYCQALAGMH